MTTTRTYTKVCAECGEDYQSRHNSKIASTCSDMACIRVATDKHNAAVRAYDAESARRRETSKGQPRAPRQQYVYGDLGQLAILHGMVRKGGK